MKIHGDVYEQEQKRLAEQRNYDAWLYGVYSLDAIGAVFGKHHKYPSEPYPIGEHKEPTQMELRERIKSRVEQIRSNRKVADIIGPPLGL